MVVVLDVDLNKNQPQIINNKNERITNKSNFTIITALKIIYPITQKLIQYQQTSIKVLY